MLGTAEINVSTSRFVGLEIFQIISNLCLKCSAEFVPSLLAQKSTITFYSHPEWLLRIVLGGCVADVKFFETTQTIPNCTLFTFIILAYIWNSINVCLMNKLIGPLAS